MFLVVLLMFFVEVYTNNSVFLFVTGTCEQLPIYQ